MRPNARVLADFEGVWTLERRIIHKSQPPAGFSGEAVWRRVPGGMAYTERGALTLEGHALMQSEQRYFWRDDLAVEFDDGRFFHQVPALGGEAGHWCDPDQYDGRYDFSDWPRFEVVWKVRGPAKDYRMVSEYARAGG